MRRGEEKEKEENKALIMDLFVLLYTFPSAFLLANTKNKGSLYCNLYSHLSENHHLFIILYVALTWEAWLL